MVLQINLSHEAVVDFHILTALHHPRQARQLPLDAEAAARRKKFR